MFKKITWNGAFLFLGWLCCLSAIAALTLLIVLPKPTVGYSLGTKSDSDQRLSIIKEIEWCKDDCIPLDRAITYQEAINLVDSLNKTLK